MGHAKTEPVLSELITGRRFRKRPSLKVVETFLRHVGRTGSPHTWQGISTTTPAKSSHPVLLKKFTIPDAFRRRAGGRAPCPICCPYFPKYETGFLAWHPDDGLVRAIGQECGAEFFDDDSFADALAAYDREEAERRAREYLADAYPLLVERMVQAWFVRLELAERLRMRDEFVSKITKKAVDQLRRLAASDGTLHVNFDTEQRDDKGRLIVGTRAVARIDGLTALLSSGNVIEKLSETSMAVGQHACTALDELHDHVQALSGVEAVELEKLIRAFNEAFDMADRLNGGLASFLTVKNLIELGRYGAHRDCGTPFWVAQVQNAAFAGKGIKPATLPSYQGAARLRLPADRA